MNIIVKEKIRTVHPGSYKKKRVIYLNTIKSNLKINLTKDCILLLTDNHYELLPVDTEYINHLENETL